MIAVRSRAESHAANRVNRRLSILPGTMTPRSSSSRGAAHDSRILVLFHAALPPPLTRSGARRNRSRAFNRRASFEALEDRRLLSSTVSFSTGTETVDESAGTFSIPVTLSGPPSAPPPISGLRLWVRWTRRPGLRRRRQPLCRQPRQRHGGRGVARGRGHQHNHPGSTIPGPWPSTPPATSTSPTQATTR